MSDQPTTEGQSSHAVLMFTDIVDSVGLKTRIGAAAYARAVGRHDALFLRIMRSLPGARVLKDQGDGFMARFETASSAVEAALRFQRALRLEPADPERCVVRVGIHMGEVADVGPDQSGGNKIVGLAIDLASRIESLALPGQILLSRSAFDDARQFIRDHPAEEGVEGLPELRWKAHGPYRFKGLDDAVEIYEVGAPGIAPLAPPPDSVKATRCVPAGDESMYDWRPAAGQEIPGQRGWILEEKLGAGGFGEVWLGLQQQTRHKRAFKFCFDADRLRSLKKELAFFQILLRNLGERDDIARLFDVRLDVPPFYLVSEYSPEGDLETWFESRGGAKVVSLSTRLDIVSRAARALAAAHSVGVLHKDLKPRNILVDIRDGGPRPKIADFGISELTEKGARAASQLTSASMTGDTELLSTETTGTGSQMYCPPEQMRGDEFTPQGDVYALGVVLYQLVVGDLSRPLGHGWERGVKDPLLREDIAGCVTADLGRRFNSPNELADRLEALGPRRRAMWMRRAAASVATLLIALSLVGYVYSTSRHYRLERELNQNLEEANAQLTGIQRVWHETMKAADPQHSGQEQATVDSILDASVAMLDDGRLDDAPLAEAEARLRLGRTFIGRGRLDDAEQQIESALRIREQHGGSVAAILAADANHYLAYLQRTKGDTEGSRELYETVLADRERLLGESHPDTALTRYELSVTLRSSNELEESRAQLERAMRDIVGWRRGQQSTGAAALERYREIDVEIARMHNSRARMLHRLGELDEAEEAARESLRLRRELLGPQHRDVTRSMMSLVWLESDRGNLREAERLQRQVLAIRRDLLGSEHREVASAKYWLARLLLRQGRFDEAERLASESMVSRQSDFGDDSPAALRSRVVLARAIHGRGAPEEAVGLLFEARKIALDAHPADEALQHDVMGPLGAALCGVGRCLEGVPMAREAYAFVAEREHEAAWRSRDAAELKEYCGLGCSDALPDSP